MKKNILVIDSYHGDFITKMLKRFYGEEGNIYYEKDGRIFSFSKELEVIAMGEKIDVLFLSGKLILDRILVPDALRQKFGTSNSKVVAMSTMPSFLQRIKNGNYGVDFFIDKSLLDKTGDDDVQQLFRSFLQ